MEEGEVYSKMKSLEFKKLGIQEKVKKTQVLQLVKQIHATPLVIGQLMEMINQENIESKYHMRGPMSVAESSISLHSKKHANHMEELLLIYTERTLINEKENEIGVLQKYPEKYNSIYFVAIREPLSYQHEDSNSDAVVTCLLKDKMEENMSDDADGKNSFRVFGFMFFNSFINSDLFWKRLIRSVREQHFANLKSFSLKLR